MIPIPASLPSWRKQRSWYVVCGVHLHSFYSLFWVYFFQHKITWDPVLPFLPQKLPTDFPPHKLKAGSGEQVKDISTRPSHLQWGASGSVHFRQMPYQVTYICTFTCSVGLRGCGCTCTLVLFQSSCLMYMYMCRCVISFWGCQSVHYRQGTSSGEGTHTWKTCV